MIDPRNSFCICDFETTGIDTDKDMPIEIGCIFTDSNFVVKDIYSNLIFFQETRELIDNNNQWKTEGAKTAFEYHRIPAGELLNGHGPRIIAEDIVKKVQENVSDVLSRINLHAIAPLLVWLLTPILDYLK